MKHHSKVMAGIIVLPAVAALVMAATKVGEPEPPAAGVLLGVMAVSVVFLILPKFLATDAFFVFLMVQFIRGIPRELDEAARIDGCG